jgi:uncharacterized protein with GYD domain
MVGRETMATYILLASFTDQGIRKIKDSPKRADAFKDMAKKCGATVKDVFWTLGAYDVVAVVEAPDDISMTALGLSTGALGNVRTQTLRAFTPADMKTILGRWSNDFALAISLSVGDGVRAGAAGAGRPGRVDFPV